MRDANVIIRQRQLAIRREMDRRGILLKVVAQDSGIPYPTLLTYFPAEGSRDPATIPGCAIFALAEGNALPLDLLSTLLPAGVVIVAVPEEINPDEVERACRDFLAAKGNAHHPQSPGGREISECEQAILRGKVAVLRAAA